ncbi:hypothetical protein [Alkalicoccus luteus]|uniref:Uncharacterized protein n=1 Tax=Alkalicoccus luteus TaxID=1237094 RepID=A0A969PTC5_9BACI|nr:hypothetical protein [Alkalicoccus luteus]NJP38011.1 hypothetical protein [Alkalicoccus luteus]
METGKPDLADYIMALVTSNLFAVVFAVSFAVSSDDVYWTSGIGEAMVVLLALLVRFVIAFVVIKLVMLLIAKLFRFRIHPAAKATFQVKQGKT